MNNLHILSILTWLPTVGAIIIMALFKKNQGDSIKKFATAWFGLAFIASLVLLKYDRVIGGMQFLEDHQWIPVIGARYQMGVDGVAVLLIVLTTLLGAIASLSSWNYIQKREKEYYVLLLLLQTAVVGVLRRYSMAGAMRSSCGLSPAESSAYTACAVCPVLWLCSPWLPNSYSHVKSFFCCEKRYALARSTAR